MEKAIKERKPFDRKKFIWETANQSAKELKKIMNEKSPDLDSLNPKLKERVQSLLKERLNPFNSLRDQYHILGKVPESEELRNQYETDLESMFIAGQIKMKEDPIDALQDYFWPIVEHHLYSPETHGEIFDKSLQYSKVIARNWVHSHAFDYLNMDLEDHKSFHGGHETRTYNSGYGVNYLGRIGDIADIPAIDTLMEKCREGGLEMDCNNARKQIILKNLLEISIPSNRFKLKEAGFGSDLPDYQLVDKLSFLMDRLGLSYALQALPGLKQIRRTPANPLDKRATVKEIKDLVEKGVEQTFGTRATVMASSAMMVHSHSAFRFALKHGLAERINPDVGFLEKQKWVLTNKGKNVIKSLMHDMGNVHLELMNVD